MDGELEVTMKKEWWLLPQTTHDERVGKQETVLEGEREKTGLGPEQKRGGDQSRFTALHGRSSESAPSQWWAHLERSRACDDAQLGRTRP